MLLGIYHIPTDLHVFLVIENICKINKQSLKDMVTSVRNGA